MTEKNRKSTEREEKNFLIYGRQNVREFLRAVNRPAPQQIIFHQSLPNKLRDLLEKKFLLSGKCNFTVKKSLAEISQEFPHIHHQGVILTFSEKNASILKGEIRSKETWLEVCCRLGGPIVLLADLQDIQNAGNMARSAECLGVSILLLSGRKIEVNQRFYQISSGAAHHLHLYTVGNTHQCVQQLKKEGFFICGGSAEKPSSLSSEKKVHTNSMPLTISSTEVHRLPKNKKIALMIGEEHQGLGPLMQKECDYLLHIPLRGKTKSLNAATAGAILIDRLMNQTGDE